MQRGRPRKLIEIEESKVQSCSAKERGSARAKGRDSARTRGSGKVRGSVRSQA